MRRSVERSESERPSTAADTFDALLAALTSSAREARPAKLLELLVPNLADSVLVHRLWRGDVVRQDAAHSEGLEEVEPLLAGVAARVLTSSAARVFRPGAPSHSLPHSEEAELSDWLREHAPGGYICTPLVGSEGRVLGSLTLLRTHARPAFSDAELGWVGRVAGLLALWTQAHEAREERESTLESTAVRARTNEAYLMEASHELRSPLNAIIGWTHLIQRGELDAEHAQRALETVDRNAHSLARIADSLVDLARLAAGTLSIEEKLLPFREVVERAVAATRVGAELRHQHVEIYLEGDPRVLGDAARLQQVVESLLIRASKSSPVAANLGIHLLTHGTSTMLRVEVSPSADAPPERAAGARLNAALPSAERRDPAGLAIALARRVAELHGGALRTRSTPHGGMLLELELPLNPAENEAPPQSKRAPATVPPPSLLTGVSALVVEDDPDGCELIEAVLRGFGASVVSAGSARDALSLLGTRAVDVIVSDIGLPDEDGFSLLRRVRRDPRFSELPAIALTAYTSKRDVASAFEAGFQAHLSKPVQARELGDTLAELIGRSREKA